MKDIRGKELLVILNSVPGRGIGCNDLERALINRVPRIGRRFGDSLNFLIQLGFIEKHNSTILARLTNVPVTKNQLGKRILENRLLAREFIAECRSLRNQSARKSNVILNKSQVSVKFVWFVLLLEQLGVLLSSHSANYRVVDEWTDAFLNFVHAGVSASFRSNPPSRYSDALEKNIEVGTRAEEFVLKFERQRLANHALVDWIKYVAIEDVGAGFDILSFNGNNDYIPNRMIEVKSWVGNRGFYLSANELQVAKSNKDFYYIYLVNRDAMNDEGYVPEIFEFQSSHFFDDAKRWIAIPDGWRIESALGR